MAEQTTFTFELDAAQQERLQALLAVGNFKPRQVPYSLVAVEGDGFNCALYQKEKHGRRKLCIQGGKARDFVEFFLEPNAVVPVSMGGVAAQTALPGMEGVCVGVASSESAPLPHGGSDESGKGDYFGPLVVACCYVDDYLAKRLKEMRVEWYDARDVKHVDTDGVRDCKLITNNVVLLRMGTMIRELLGPDRFSVVKIGPAAYNRLYAKIKNINRLLAWAHGTCIEGLLEKQTACPRVVVDQFAPTETVIRRALKERGKRIAVEQRHKAESYSIAVAAASVLARESFLRALCDMAKDVDPTATAPLGVVPLGSSDPRVRELAERMARAHGPVWLMNHCKAHFQTTDKVLAAIGKSRADLPPEGQVVSAVANGTFKGFHKKENKEDG
ncbi:MAG: ribonuclease HIII [Kiritimatiellae bacterium]|nr:ribonuclease HIII [Kiritimatiellia bacterium]